MIKALYLKIALTLSIMVILGAMIAPSAKAQTCSPCLTIEVGGPQLAAELNMSALSTLEHAKTFVLDGLAWRIAKLMVQQMTASTVNWINSGFQGSPAFLTNPEGFFLDVGDQLTGQFISKDGALSQLCSPFSIDVRLAIALNASASSRGSSRYACTLSTIIDNVSGGAGSIEGFVNGDFNQGGWPAFIALTTEPQNNAFGAYLTAQSDLLDRISQKQNMIKADLSYGNGFMSWQNCKTIAVVESGGGSPDIGSLTGDQLNQLQTQGGSIATSPGSGISAHIDEQGNTTYQECITETPGSVINGSLQKQLDAPIDELNLADSINEIVGALMSQLVGRVLSGGGLYSASRSSGGSSGGGGSYTSRLTADSATQAASVRQAATATIIPGNTLNSGYPSDVQEYLKLRTDAVNIVTTVEAKLVAAKACFQSVPNQDISQGFANKVQETIDDILGVKKDYRDKLAQANRDYPQQNLSTAGLTAEDLNDPLIVQTLIAQQVAASQSSSSNRPNVDEARRDVQTAEFRVAFGENRAGVYMQQCRNLGGH